MRKCSAIIPWLKAAHRERRERKQLQGREEMALKIALSANDQPLCLREKKEREGRGEKREREKERGGGGKKLRERDGISEKERERGGWGEEEEREGERGREGREMKSGKDSGVWQERI